MMSTEIGLDDQLRHQLEEAAHRHWENPSSETRAEYGRLLRIFADLILYGRAPAVSP